METILTIAVGICLAACVCGIFFAIVGGLAEREGIDVIEPWKPSRK